MRNCEVPSLAQKCVFSEGNVSSTLELKKLLTADLRDGRVPAQRSPNSESRSGSNKIEEKPSIALTRLSSRTFEL